MKSTNLFNLILIALIILVAYAFFTAVDVFAGSDVTVAICDTVDHNKVAAYDGVNVDNDDAQTRHCVAPNAPKTQKHNKTNDTVSTMPTSTPIAPVAPIVTVEPTQSPVAPDNTPVVTSTPDVPNTPVSTPATDKCNNGFGNGPDTACKTHGNAQNQDNTGTQQNGHDMSSHTDKFGK